MEPDASATAAQTERASDRRRVLKAGRIELKNRSVIDCTVRNISRTGARLRVEESYWIPEHFTIDIPSEGLRRTCRVQWRNAVDLGVKFDEPE